MELKTYKIMSLTHIYEKGGEDYREYKHAVKMAKKAIEKICELTEDMEDEYGFKERSSSEDEHPDVIERGGRMYKRMR